ncbi:MAG: hypothetical protein ACM3O9_05075 [Methylocystaceae bacterium]
MKQRLGYFKWISVMMVVLLLASVSMASATEGKAKETSKKSSANLSRESQLENKARLRLESQALLKEIKQQALQVKQLSRSVEVLNGQLQKQLQQVQKNKIRLTPQEVQILREHLQVVRNSSQRLVAGERNYKQAQQQYQQYQQLTNPTMIETLVTIKSAQEQKIQELTALQTELQKLTGFLGVKSKS